MRHCISSARLAQEAESDSDNVGIGMESPMDAKYVFLPVFRLGICAEIGPKQYMEDEHISIDNLLKHLGASFALPAPRAFYGAFDGHCGSDAALFIRKNIINFIIEDSHFPTCVEKAIRRAYVKVDHAFADARSLDSTGTTALTALIFGRTMLTANAGDCRAVLGKRDIAIELSKDHKQNCTSERLRIEKLGGIICDGYVDGQLSVALALGDWHMKGPKSPLPAL